MRSAHWRLYFLCVAGPLVCEEEVFQAATATSVTKRMAGRSAQSLSPELLDQQGQSRLPAESGQ